MTCYRKDAEGKIEVLDDTQCPDEKPEAEKKCNLRPCEGVDWVTTEWSGVKTSFFPKQHFNYISLQCESKCGLTNETRKAQCATADGKVYPDNLCEDTPLPELVRECKNVNTSCEFQWYASEWSEVHSLLILTIKGVLVIIEKVVFSVLLNVEVAFKLEEFSVPHSLVME